MSKKQTTGSLDVNSSFTIESNKLFEIRLEGLKSEDEMEVLLHLQELSRELLVANDQIADDANCQFLIKELIDLLDKFYHLPDVGMTSLLCLNSLLDINPLFTTNIVKNGGIPKIIMMTQNLEYIDLAETSIKSLEKISTENPQVLLENDALTSIYNLTDFLELSLRVFN